MADSCGRLPGDRKLTLFSATDWRRIDISGVGLGFASSLKIPGMIRLIVNDVPQFERKLDV